MRNRKGVSPGNTRRLRTKNRIPDWDQIVYELRVWDAFLAIFRNKVMVGIHGNNF